MEYTYNGLLRFWHRREGSDPTAKTGEFKDYYTGKTKISDVMTDPAFDDYGRLIFPADEGYYSGDTLEELRLTWYSHIDPDKTVEIANYFRNRVQNDCVIFYDIYTDEEKADDPPTYACVGDSDGIASWRVMKSRLEGMSALGTDTEFHVYKGLGHGFGLGTGTSAEGWLDDAAAFWEKQSEKE